MTFKDDNVTLQVLVRELFTVQNHNKGFREGDPQDKLLMFAEIGLICMTMEHFVRIALAKDGVVDATLSGATLYNLLEMAVARKLLILPFADPKDGIKKICAVRNTLLHGNYAEAAAHAKCANVTDYFKTQYAAELRVMTEITDNIMQQIDPRTGKRHAPV